MKSVEISRKGTLENLKETGYDLQGVVCEKLNNVIHKNHNPDYSVSILNGDVKHRDVEYGMIAIYEKYAVGFVSSEQLKQAFTLNESCRSGLNNRGMGIYSPVCIDKRDITGLFIQSNSNGNFLTVIKSTTSDLDVSHNEFTFGHKITLLESGSPCLNLNKK